MASMTDAQRRQQKNQIALDQSNETPGAGLRAKLIQAMRGESIAPDPASVGGNLRSSILDSILAPPTQPQLALPNMPAGGPTLAQAPGVLRQPGSALPGQAPGSMGSAIDEQFNPLIKAAGTVETPKTAIGDQIFPALAQAFSVGFSNDPAAALQNQLTSQKVAAEREQARKDAAKQAALGLKKDVAVAKISLLEKEKDRLAKQDDETRRWLMQQTGKEALSNLRFDQEKKLFDLNTGESRAQLANNQTFQEKLALASRGDHREATRITNEFTLRELLPGVKPEEIKDATNRIFFSDKINPKTGKPYGDATKRDGELIAQAHAREQAQKEKLSGRDKDFDPEKFVGSVYTTALKETDTKPLLKADGTISVDPFSGRPNVIPLSPEERFQNAAATANAAQEWLKARGKLTPALPKVTPTADLSKQQKAAEIAAVDPDAALRAQGAAVVDTYRQAGKTDAEITALIANSSTNPVAKEGAAARLREKANVVLK